MLTTLTFRAEPAFRLASVERPTARGQLLDTHDELVAGHHHVDAYWFPHTDRCLVKCHDRTLDPAQPLSPVRGYVEDELLSNTLFGTVDRFCTRWPAAIPTVNRLTSRGWGHRRYSDAASRVLVKPRRVVFREMEYSVPHEAGMAELAEVRRRLESSGVRTAWPVEIRATPPDEAWLSTSHGRPSVYLAFHVGAGSDHRPYFAAVEPVLRAHDGRPHWGKLHTRTARDLAPAYSRWDDFVDLRDRVDPDRPFGNDYLERVLG